VKTCTEQKALESYSIVVVLSPTLTTDGTMKRKDRGGREAKNRRVFGDFCGRSSVANVELASREDARRSGRENRILRRRSTLAFSHGQDPFRSSQAPEGCDAAIVASLLRDFTHLRPTDRHDLLEIFHFIQCQG
jgi:hypothetical protein